MIMLFKLHFTNILQTQISYCHSLTDSKYIQRNPQKTFHEKNSSPARNSGSKRNPDHNPYPKQSLTERHLNRFIKRIVSQLHSCSASKI